MSQSVEVPESSVDTTFPTSIDYVVIEYKQKRNSLVYAADRLADVVVKQHAQLREAVGILKRIVACEGVDAMNVGFVNALSDAESFLQRFGRKEAE